MFGYGDGGGFSSTMPGGFGDDTAGTGYYKDGNFDAGSTSQGGAAGTQPGAGAQNAYSWAWDFFTGKGADRQGWQQAENAQFGNVFEEMLREEGMADPGTGQPTGRFWGVMGGLSGGTLGFIVGNVPGMVAGVVAGNRLGAVRDAKGKSVYDVFKVRGSVRWEWQPAGTATWESTWTRENSY
jgi:hypothetical protein